MQQVLVRANFLPDEGRWELVIGPQTYAVSVANFKRIILEIRTLKIDPGRSGTLCFDVGQHQSARFRNISAETWDSIVEYLSHCEACYQELYPPRDGQNKIGGK